MNEATRHPWTVEIWNEWATSRLETVIATHDPDRAQRFYERIARRTILPVLLCCRERVVRRTGRDTLH